MNIGNDGIAAIKDLRGLPAWNAMMNSLERVATEYMNRAVESGAPDACGYARATRDLYMAFTSATKGVSVNQVKKPGSPAQAKE